jgi:hypothetical protein
MITIDLNQITHTTAKSYLTIQRKLITEIVRVKNEYSMKNINFSRLLCGSPIFNIISDSNYFKVESNTPKVKDIEDGIVKMGQLMDMEVFVSIHVPRNEIHLTIGTVEIRDQKIDYLLDKDIQKENTIEIRVISDFL